ncbi:MAG: endonuclease/exonuclease/phosphatase family protein [Candidatus Thiodiazotropha sp.]
MQTSLRQINLNPLEAASFNFTIIQVYAPTSGHDDSEVDNFYQELQEIIDQTPKKDILVVQGEWNAKVRKDAQAAWGTVCGPYCNAETNERGFRLLEFEAFNNLVLTNTLSPHKPSKRWTWHSPDMKHHNQIDYILVRKRFRLGVNIHRTRSFPGAEIGSDHDLEMMTFGVRLKKARKPTKPRLRFDLKKLRNPDMAGTFHQQ